MFVQSIKQAKSHSQEIKKRLFHSQIVSRSAKTMIYTMFDYDEMVINCYKVMQVPQALYLFLMNLCIIRADIFKAIAKVKRSNDQFSTQKFSEKLFFQKQQKEQSNELLFRIKKVFFKGKDLSECIKQHNSISNNYNNKLLHNQDSEEFSFVRNLIVNLINFFVRFEKSGLIIPTFKTVLFDPTSRQFSLNIFSFVGVSLFKYSGEIQQSQLREILPFLSNHMFQDQKSWISLPKAIAVLVLGIFLGKEINLITSKDKVAKTKAEVRELVKRNSEKFEKILKSRHLSQLIVEFEKKENLKLTNFFRAVLVEQRQLSWPECINYLTNNISNTFKLRESEQQIQMQKIDLWLKDFANFKWTEMSKEQKLFYIQNKVISIVHTKQRLTERADYQMFLIVLIQIDFGLLKHSFDLCQFLHEIQEKNITFCFNSSIMHLINSFISKFFEKSKKQRKAERFQIQSTLEVLYLLQSSNMQSEELKKTLITPQDTNKYQLQVPKQNTLIQSAYLIQSQIQIQRQSQSAKTQSQLIKSNIENDHEGYTKNSLSDPNTSGDSLLEMLSQNDQSILQEEFHKKSWFIDNFSTVCVQPQIHKFKTSKESSELYRLQSSRLQTWRQYEKCFIK